MLELRDRIVALEARRDVLRGFACDSRTPLVDRIARAIQPCMLVDVGLIRPASRDAIAEIADYLESEGLTGAAGQLRRQLRAES
jgi:hypothetical protein